MRPQLRVRRGFDESDGAYQDMIVHTLPDVKGDVSLYLKDEMAKIPKVHSDLMPWSLHWPSHSEFDNLLALSVPFFIAAAALCRLVGDRKIGAPKSLLKKLLSESTDGSSDLYGIYRTKLENSTPVELPEETLEEFRRVASAIILLVTPLHISVLTELIDMPREDIDDRLSGLHSVLSIPHTAEASTQLLHLLLRDVLLKPDKPGNICDSVSPTGKVNSCRASFEMSAACQQSQEGHLRP